MCRHAKAIAENQRLIEHGLTCTCICANTHIIFAYEYIYICTRIHAPTLYKVKEL